MRDCIQTTSILGANTPTPARTPSLEERLDYLQRGVERLVAIRGTAQTIADRLCMEPTGTGSSVSAPPPPQDLTTRYGETIMFLHTMLDALERDVTRIREGLFDERNKVQCEKRA